MTSRVLFAGIPHTGKTSYLALLHLGITRRRYTTIKLGSYQDDRDYLNSLAQPLFDCENADRTEVSQSNGMGLSIKLPTGVDTVLSIPDMSGEIWQDLLVERTWGEDLEQDVLEASGVCIFVNVSEFSGDLTLAQAAQLGAALGETPPPDGENPNAPFARPEQETGQIQLVDLLQLLGDQYGRPGRRISVILSAFDTVSGQSPDTWLRSNAPLVAQYLDANSGRFAIALFGLSAQGGRFDEKKSKASLLKRDPLDRAFLLTSDGSPANLDEPILWALAGA